LKSAIPVIGPAIYTAKLVSGVAGVAGVAGGSGSMPITIPPAAPLP
jgi:hypothetical protein